MHELGAQNNWSVWQDRPRAGLLSWLGLSVLTGTVGGALLPIAWWVWLCCGVLFVLVFKRTPLSKQSLCVICLLTASMVCLRVQSPAGIGVLTMGLDTQPQLIQVRGRVISSLSSKPSADGTMADYDFGRPRTQWLMGVDAIRQGDVWQSATGSVQVVGDGVVDWIKEGQQIEAIGWLSAFSPARNPGGFDRAAWGQRQGLVGQISLADDAATVRVIKEPAGVWAVWIGLREKAEDVLQAGVQDVRVAGLLNRLMLGRSVDDASADPSDTFARVGLAHVMSLSGAHLAIVLLVAGYALRVCIPNPRIASWVIGFALILFLLLVPWRVPIVRAAIMAMAVLGAFGFGRRVGMTDRVGLAVAIVLWVRPSQWSDPGFQLTFGVVTALSLWATPMVKMLEDKYRRFRQLDNDDLLGWGTRGLIDMWVVGVIAFVVSWPLVCFHFEQTHPWTIVAGLLVLLPVTVFMTLALSKLVLGMLLPVLAGVLAPGVEVVGGFCMSLVAWFGRLPASELRLAEAPSVLWVVLAMGGCAGVFEAHGRMRRLPIGLILISVIWLIFLGGRIGTERYPVPDQGGLSVTALSVSDGSAWVIRTNRHAFLYDCGSQVDVGVGRRVAEAMRVLRVDKLDAVFVSHADLDHYVGVLDLVDQVSVDRVLMPRQTVARIKPGSALQAMLDGLAKRDVSIEFVQQGWSKRIDGVRIDAVWPASEWMAEADNDNALVLSFKAGGRRVILFGDNETTSIRAMLDRGLDLKADIAEAPHHGAANGLTAFWLEAVSPKVVIQSSGRTRLQPQRDPWLALSEQATGITRWTTGLSGAVTAEVDASGAIRVSSVLDNNGKRD